MRVVSAAQIGIDPSSPTPLHRQVYEQLREAVLSRRLRAGVRLPSTRMLATELSVSRNTVLSAYEQLLAEGYLEARVGSATYVAGQLPDDILCVRAQTAKGLRLTRANRGPSRRGAMIDAARPRCHVEEHPPRPFRPGLPAIDEFPSEVWARLLARYWRHPSRHLSAYGHSAGYRPLRKAIAEYVREARGVRCDAEQVIVVAGSQQGLDLAARVLLDPGDSIWIEDPGYIGARGAFLAAGARLIPVPIDREGIDVASAIAVNETARMVYVTPSHQYPLGVVMSLPRRLTLLHWASRSGAWILEDDYDSEYRYTGRPVASLQGLDNEGCVIYLGTFSKVLSPALRLGYLVAPPDLVNTFTAARSLADEHSPTMLQAALAEFIAEGHFARHVRRMRVLYAERQAAMVEAARELAGLLDVEAGEAGLHLVGWLPQGVDDRAAALRAGEHGVDVRPLSDYSLRPLSRGGLMLGYAAFTPGEIREGIKRLAAALRAASSQKRPVRASQRAVENR